MERQHREAGGGGGVAHAHAHQRDAGNRARRRLCDMAADHAHPHDPDLQHGPLLSMVPFLQRKFGDDSSAPRGPTRDRARIPAGDSWMPSSPRLQEPLDRLYREFDWAARADQDAIRYPLRFDTPADREVVALLAACMAYGRVDLFGPWIDWALARMGESPARFVLGFDPAKHAARFEGFRYRFNRPRDLAAFCLATQRILNRHGSLGAWFGAGFSPGDPHVGPALEAFV